MINTNKYIILLDYNTYLTTLLFR